MQDLESKDFKLMDQGTLVMINNEKPCHASRGNLNLSEAGKKHQLWDLWLLSARKLSKHDSRRKRV